MSDSTPVAHSLADQLIQAWPGNGTLVTLNPAQVPASEQESYAIQDQIIASLSSPVAAWKVGSKSSDGPMQAAPIPAVLMQNAPLTIQRSAYGVLVLELELAFRFNRDFASSQEPYADDEVLGAISHTVTTIELVSSRYAGWPVDKLAMLADLQSHGGLVVGEAVPYDASYPFAAPSLTCTLDGQNIAPETTRNTAGDPRRLLPLLVNHASRRGIAMPEGTLVTCGTYIGMYKLNTLGTVVGQFQGLPEIRLTIV